MLAYCFKNKVIYDTMWLVGQISADQMFKEVRMKTELHFLKKRKKVENIQMTVFSL